MEEKKEKDKEKDEERECGLLHDNRNFIIEITHIQTSIFFIVSEDKHSNKSCKETVLQDAIMVLNGIGKIDVMMDGCEKATLRCFHQLPHNFMMLPYDEAFAIALYTFDLQLQSSNGGHDNFYFILNQVL